MVPSSIRFSFYGGMKEPPMSRPDSTFRICLHLHPSLARWKWSQLAEGPFACEADRKVAGVNHNVNDNACSQFAYSGERRHDTLYFSNRPAV